MNAKTIENIAEVIGKWVAEGHSYPTTTLEIEEMLKWYYDPAGYTKADVETAKRILESRPDRPQWDKTAVSPFVKTISPGSVMIFSKNIPQETMLGPKLDHILEKSTSGIGEYIFEELALNDVVDTLELTIVHDLANKKIVLLCGVLNYTNEDQQNVAFSSGSSTGKSHICLEIAKLFPEEDVQKLGYTSPQAFIHALGILTNDAGLPLVMRDKFVSDNVEHWQENNPRPEERGEKTEWKEQRTRETSRLKGIWNAIPKVYRVDLHQKILIFLDQPHDLLLTRLRALLSHDDKVIRSKITDRSSSGSHRTKDVDLVGFPSVWFLTTHFSPDEQERSRMVMLSAEITQEKIKASLDMVSKKLADRDAFQDNVDSNEKRNELKARIRAIKEAGIEEVIIADEDREKIIKAFKKEHSHLAPRQQRDFPRLVAFIKGHALLNLFNREREDNRIWANETDIKAGKKLYAEIAESNELGLPPVIYGVWKDIIKPTFDMGEGIRIDAVAVKYYKEYRERIGGKRLDSMIDILVEVGLVIRISDPDDRRRVLLWSPDMEIPKSSLDTKEKTEAMAARASGTKRRKKKKPSDSKTGPLQGDVRRKPLPRAVKQFEKWLKPLSNAGQRGFKESEAKAAHGEGYLEQLSKYVKKGWIEQRGDSETWWISDTGKAALQGDS